MNQLITSYYTSLLMFIRFPSDQQTWSNGRQFMWGDALLISPVITEVNCCHGNNHCHGNSSCHGNGRFGKVHMYIHVYLYRMQPVSLLTSLKQDGLIIERLVIVIKGVWSLCIPGR